MTTITNHQAREKVIESIQWLRTLVDHHSNIHTQSKFNVTVNVGVIDGVKMMRNWANRKY